MDNTTKEVVMTYMNNTKSVLQFTLSNVLMFLKIMKRNIIEHEKEKSRLYLEKLEEERLIKLSQDLNNAKLINNINGKELKNFKIFLDDDKVGIIFDKNIDISDVLKELNKRIYEIEKEQERQKELERQREAEIDIDHDGYSNNEEVSLGSDPYNPNSTPNSRTKDKELDM